MASLIMYSGGDIGRDLAIRAHGGTSWTPEKRGDSVVREYMAHMYAVDQEFSQWVTEENREAMVKDLERYRAGYTRLLRAYLGSRANIVSPMIAGPARFPVRQMEKRNAWADAHAARLREFSQGRLKKLRSKYDPARIARAPISSDDQDAPARLQAKIDVAEKLQETMKAANRVIRGKGSDEEKAAALVGLGLSQAHAWKLLQPDYMNSIGFPAWALSNNNANIRRMRERLAELERARQDTTSTEQYGDVRLVDNVPDNRVQLFFPGKPPEATLTRLKGWGFRWTPSIKAWQRKRCTDTMYKARIVAREYAEGEGKDDA